MKRLMILAAAAIASIVVSCNKSDVQVVPTPEGEPNATPVSVSLITAPIEGQLLANKVSTPASESVRNAMTVEYGSAVTVVTKSMTSLTATEEQAVKNLWVIQFNKADKKIVGQPYYAPSTDITQNGTTVTASVNLTSATTAQIVYFVANVNSPSAFNATNCATYDDLEKLCQTLAAEYKPSAASGLPMLISKEFPKIESATPLTGVTLKRLVSKVILKYKIDNFPGFVINSVTLKNVSKTISYCAEKTTAVNFPVKNVTVGSESHIDYPAEDPTKAVADGDYKTFTWYVPENLRTSSAIAAAGDRTLDKTDGMATYIEIKGVLKSAAKCEKLTYNILLGDAATTISDCNVRRNNIYTATVTIQGSNALDHRIDIEKFDQNNAAMIVPGSGDAGSVTFDIRKLTNGWKTTMPTLGAGAALRADVLWQDGDIVNTADVSLDKVNGLLTVRSSKATKGNAIVALYDATSGGNILWSWHIWVTDYKPVGQAAVAANTAYAVPNGQVHVYGAEYLKVNAGKVIMDRNLGATTAFIAPPATIDNTNFGMFYQWGRKDPLPRWDGLGSADATAATIKIYAANGTTVLDEGVKDNTTATGYKKVSIATAGSTPPSTLAYATKNPLSFIYSAAAPFDWYTTATDNSAGNGLWGDGAQKSAYDPCPAGWRIAPNGTWSDFGTNPYAAPFYYYINGTKQLGSGNPIPFVQSGRNGRFYEPSSGTVRAWYPAPGYRDFGRDGFEGVIRDVGYSGYSWASTVSGTNAYFLYFYPTYIYPSGANYRGHGFQVRCLQE